MKKIFALAVSALVAVSAFAGGGFADISVAEVNTLATSKSAVIIDVNGTDSYKAGHVPTALNYDNIEDKLAANLPKDKGALIVAYCGNPQCPAYARAAKAAQKLGYTNIKHMSAGIAGWKAAGMKTEPGS
jgi:rhodanese-related sulfurtransferase